MARNKNSEYNKLIRDRIPGGAELIEVLKSLDRMATARPDDEHASDALDLMRSAMDLLRERMKVTRRWPPPTYSAAQAAEITGIAKRTINEICKRKGLGCVIAGRVALTVEDVIEVRSSSQGRPGAPAGNVSAKTRARSNA